VKAVEVSSKVKLPQCFAGVDPVSSVSTEHAPAQRRRGGSGPGPGLLPGGEGPADLLLLPVHGPGREAVAGQGAARRQLVPRRSGGAAVPPLRELLPAAVLLAVLLILLPGAGLRLTNESARFSCSLYSK